MDGLFQQPAGAGKANYYHYVFLKKCMKISLDTLFDLVTKTLTAAGASPSMAAATARALIAAEEEGLASHGVSRAPYYAAHLRNGRADGKAVPRIVRAKGGACLVDAHNGLAFEACALAVDEAIKHARAHGVAFCGVANSHHFGAAAIHLMPVAEQNMVGLAFSNSPPAMPAWGGRKLVFGTNPIAAMFPRQNAAPIIIDLSLTTVTRGKIMLAAQAGQPIPEGWVVDEHGNPTTDANAALRGGFLPIGGVKGAMLALMVEILVSALTGAALSFQVESFFSETGGPMRIGQVFLVIDPGALAGHEIYFERVETLIAAMLAEPDVRLPGERRHKNRVSSRQHGVEIPERLYEEVVALSKA